MSGGDWNKGVGAFGLAGGIGFAAFGASWGSIGVGLAFAASPLVVLGMVGLAAYGGYQLATN